MSIETPHRQTQNELRRNRIEALQVDLEQTAASVTILQLREAEAREKMAREDPRTAMYAVGAKPYEFRKKAAEAQRKVETLKAEIASLQAVAAEGDVGDRVAELTVLAKEAAGQQAEEREGWAEIAEHLTAFLKCFVERVVVPAERRDQMYLEAESSGLLNEHPAEEVTAAQGQLVKACSQIVHPFPTTADRCMEFCLAVMLDPMGQMAATMAKGFLPLMPDSRSVYQMAQLSSRVEKSAKGGAFFSDGAGFNSSLSDGLASLSVKG